MDKPILEIVRYKGTNGEAVKKFGISYAELFAIKNASSHLTINEIEKRIALIQPWMLSSDIYRIMGKSEEFIKQRKEAVASIAAIFSDYILNKSSYGDIE